VNIKLDQLKNSFPLPNRWKNIQCFNESVVIENIVINLVGLSVESTEGKMICGSAAEFTQIPFERAYFELLERCWTNEYYIDQKQLVEIYDQNFIRTGISPFESVLGSECNNKEWTFSKSNGVAVQRTFEKAYQGAVCELVERHLVLSSWYFQKRPEKLSFKPTKELLALSNIYRCDAFHFGSMQIGQNLVNACGFFLIPKIEGIPLVYGLGADFDQSLAILKSQKECIQRLGFLWGEEIPKIPPEVTSTPDFHQEYFLTPKGTVLIENWLYQDRKDECSDEASCMDFKIINLTPAIAKNNFKLIKVIGEKIIPLTFGPGNPMVKNLKSELLVHPVV